jgi:general nucleoside transport system permease protein
VTAPSTGGAAAGSSAPQAKVPEKLPPGRLGRVIGLAVIPVGSIILALIVGAVIILLSGLATGKFDPALPLTAYAALLSGATGISFESSGIVFNPNGPIQWLNTAAPLVLTGLAVGVGFKAGLFNIGASGQVLMGGFVAAVVGSAVATQPALIAVPVAVIAGILAGGLYGFIPGVLKAYTGAHEVVTTIMLNYIAVAVISGLVNDVLRIEGPTFARTADVGNAALPKLTGALHDGVLLALAVIPLTYFLLWRTTIGFEIRTVGANPSAARYAGMSPRLITALTMSLCGAFAGLAGTLEILGRIGYYPAIFGTSIGFDGITVALLGRAHPVGIGLSALLLGGMRAGAGLMQIKAKIPVEIVDVLQAIILLFLAADVIVRNLLRLRAARGAVEELQTVTRSYGEQAAR